MHYALLIYSPPEAATGVFADAQTADVHLSDEWVSHVRRLKEAGALLDLARLQPVETATTVRMRDGERLLTDGPFIETKEHLLGFFVIEAPDLDAALDIAALMPFKDTTTVEVRPVLPTPALTRIIEE